MKNYSSAIKYGSLTGIALIIYFLILSLFGLHQYPILGALNIAIIATAMYYGMRDFKANFTGNFLYRHGFAAGMIIGFMGTVIFTIFFALYVTELNSDFLNSFMTEWKFEWSSNMGMLLLTIILMGFALSVVLTLSYMQLLKKSWNTTEGERHTLSHSKDN
ncbi:DUF4199 domain-containing protein [Galbibacter sp. BG1]|uniref:DUF4199 domain-containing protein n=1 Tax=Galbibacter sp. BG1 TaxID=1170699 RepID=UPI0015B82E55|nr:DUF4199 domain-containing protein [Galbibacter sp. BG1]QLE02833.1 DUF4199 domain-containing protein [Galbibacter sp. BG1]